MENIKELQDYIKKMQHIINNNSSFSFLKYKFIKKSRIDDIMCCIYKALPDEYKKMLVSKKNYEKYKSIVYYRMLIKIIKHTFSFDKNMLMIDYKKINHITTQILYNIERDLNAIMKD